MMSSNPASGNHQASYMRKRHQTPFPGMGRSKSLFNSQQPLINHREELSHDSNVLTRSLSEIWELESKLGDAGVHQELEQKTTEDYLRKLNISERKPDMDIDPDEDMKLETKPARADGTVPKTYFGQHETSLPPSAASYYSANGYAARIHEYSDKETCKSIDRLNQYLKARKMQLQAGVPGKFLHAVIGQEAADVGSVVSSIMYAFYLDETQTSNDCTLPVINMKRADLNVHSELRWLLNSCHVDQSSLVFIDEIDLSYYDQFGSLQLVLLNGHNLSSKQEALKDAVVEIFNWQKDESQCSWPKAVTMAEGCSCALIAEKFAETSPETLAGYGLSRLLLSGILLDTANLTSPKCSSKDKYMATMLLKGAGRFGCNGLYQILKYKMFDTSDLKVRDILRLDFKKWTRSKGKPGAPGSRLSVPVIGMSTIGISIEQLLARECSAAQEITHFLGYYDSQKNFKRGMLVATYTLDLMRGFLHFLDVNGKDLPLKPLQPVEHTVGLQALGGELRAFEINNKVTSRRTIENLLEEFSQALRQISPAMLLDLQTTNAANL